MSYILDCGYLNLGQLDLMIIIIGSLQKIRSKTEGEPALPLSRNLMAREILAPSRFKSIPEAAPLPGAASFLVQR